MSRWRAYADIEGRGWGYKRALPRFDKEFEMLEPVEWSTWNVEVAKRIRRLAGLVADFAAEYQQKPNPKTMEALRTRIDSLATLAEDLMEEEPSALRS